MTFPAGEEAALPTAILIDGAYFIRRYKAIKPAKATDAAYAAQCAFRWAVAHLREGLSAKAGRRPGLYRILFYDCPPLDMKLHNPTTKKAVDFSRTPEAAFRNELHRRLSCMRKVALRLGHLSSDTPWTIRPEKIELLLQGKLA